MKPKSPPQVPQGSPSGTPAVHNTHRDPPDGDHPTEIGNASPSDARPVSQEAAKQTKAAAARRRLKVPDKDGKTTGLLFYWSELAVNENTTTQLCRRIPGTDGKGKEQVGSSKIASDDARGSRDHAQVIRR